MNTSMDLSNVMMSSHPTTSITTSIPKIRCKFIVAMEAAVMHINNLPSDEDFKENTGDDLNAGGSTFASRRTTGLSPQAEGWRKSSEALSSSL